MKLNSVHHKTKIAPKIASVKQVLNIIRSYLEEATGTFPFSRVW
jgi:hypothetical protein